MKKLKYFSFLSIFLVSALFLNSCHTSAFQPVAVQIENTWNFMPVVPGNTIKWTFQAGKLSITVNDVPVTFIDDNGATVTDVSYTIENKITNHYLYIDPYLVSNAPQKLLPEVQKWLIITSKSDELYLESISHDGRKGEYQFHFFRF